MWCLNTLKLLNALSHEQACKGLPERDALFVVTDPRRKKEFARRSKKHTSSQKELGQETSSQKV